MFITGSHMQPFHGQVYAKLAAADGVQVKPDMSDKLRLELQACITSDYSADQWPVLVSEFME